MLLSLSLAWLTLHSDLRLPWSPYLKWYLHHNLSGPYPPLTPHFLLFPNITQCSMDLPAVPWMDHALPCSVIFLFFFCCLYLVSLSIFSSLCLINSSHPSSFSSGIISSKFVFELPHQKSDSHASVLSQLFKLNSIIAATTLYYN